MNSYPPSWMRDPEVFGNWLLARVRFAKNTSERLGRVSRCDAICWFLTQVGHLAKAKDVKKFATAFRGRFATTHKYDHIKQTHTVDTEALDGCYSLLNTCYGGVGRDFSGKPYATWYSGNSENAYKHYGEIAPLYRPFKAHYSPTVGGMRRAARVQTMLDAIISQS